MRLLYSDVARSNVTALSRDAEYFERQKVFLYLMENFKSRGVNGAVACSMNLFLRGILDEFHDMDFIVSKESIPEIQAIMEEIGAELKGTGGNGFCESDMYLHYQLGSVDVDIICGFRLNTYGTSYYYPFNEAELDVLKVDEWGLEVPLIPLEAMYLLYYMMEGWQPQRCIKRIHIEKYFEQKGLTHVDILENALEQRCLPKHIRWAVKVLL